MDLQARFDRLSFDTRHIGTHLVQGHTRLGDFLLAYSLFEQTYRLARPSGRHSLSRNDADVFITTGGAQYAWEVVALIDGLTMVRVRDNVRMRETSVEWSHTTHTVVGGLDPSFDDLSELFETVDDTQLWEAGRHKLDLWDWIPGIIQAVPDSIIVRPNDEAGDEWLVETVGGSFLWVVIDGRNLIRPAAGRVLDRERVARLFVKTPSSE